MRSGDYILGDDQPKTNPWRDDRLGYAPFAKRLANVAINMNIPNGYVIGLHGRWGSGKTTLVNFILEYLKKHNEECEDATAKVEHIDFRPWIVAGHQDLMGAFFKLLSEHLGPPESKAKRAWRKAVRTVSDTTDQLVDAAATLALTVDLSGGAVTGLAGGLAKKSLNSYLSSYLETPSLQKAYENLKKQLAGSGRRFLVTIDDIDRLDDEEIKSIMQMVKTIGRLPNVLYLLVYDREIVWQALDQRRDRIGPKFAEKIVQQEVELPVPGKNSLLGILDQEIKFLTGNSEESMRWHHIVRDGVHRWINNPRDVLRLSNALKFAWPALEGEFDPQDLVAIEGLRLFDPEAFDWIRNNRDFLFSDGRYFMGSDDERKANVEALKISLPVDKAGMVLNLLAVLFPQQSKWIEGAGFGSSESHVAAQNRRGLASEAGYDSYFALHPTADAIPKTTLDSIFENLGDEAKIAPILKAYLGKHSSRGRSMTGLLLQDLRLRFAANSRPVPTKSFLRALLGIGEDVFQIPWRGEFFALEASGTWRFLVKDLLEIWGEEKAGKELRDAFEKSSSPFVMAELYVDRGRELSVFPSDGSSRPVITKDEFDQLGPILLPKILSAVDDGSLLGVPFYWDILRSWAYLGDSTAAQTWLRQGVQQSGHFAAKIAKGLVSQSSSGNGITYSYRSVPDDTLYEIDFIYDCAKHHLANAPDLNEDERSLLTAIVQGVDRLQAGETDDF
ncbi:P-loop NTPase fold protein [Ensifer sp. 2YAB10]|uniref:KAP family P-loop NTPase fold protein n=1 Tax=unclassified Ensifer TaxID=2633371 RepID=UPI003F8E5132